MVYGITYLVASKYSKKMLHILLLSSLMSLVVFDCSYTLEEGMVGSLCPNTILPGNLKKKSMKILKKHKTQCSEQKKTLENDIAIKSMSPKESKQKKKEIKDLEKKIRYIEEAIYDKEQKQKTTK